MRILLFLGLCALPLSQALAQKPKKADQLKEQQAQLEALKLELQTLQKNQQTTNTELLRLQDEIKGNKNEINALHNKIQVLSDQNQSLSKELESLRQGPAANLLGGMGGSQQVPQGVTSLEFDNPIHDFGKIKEGNFEHVFTVKNTGTQPLKIESAFGSCGCTVPDYPKTPIAPGQKAQIKVSFNSTGKLGQQEKYVTIMANTSPAESRLTIKAQVEK